MCNPMHDDEKTGFRSQTGLILAIRKRGLIQYWLSDQDYLESRQELFGAKKAPAKRAQVLWAGEVMYREATPSLKLVVLPRISCHGISSGSSARDIRGESLG